MRKDISYLRLSSHIAMLLIASLAIILWLYPYWYLGSSSAVGWLDEIRAQIPWYYASRHAEYGDFVHGFAGGGAVVFGYGYESISLYRTMTQLFSIETANFLMRFLGALAYFSGLYWLILNLFKSPPRLAMPIALAALLVSEGPYGWTLGGMGWDFAIAIWVALACVGRFQSLRTNYLIGLTTILIGATVSNAVFLFYYTLATALILLLYVPNFKTFIQQRWILWGVLACLMAITFLLNWRSLYYLVLGSSDFSSRLLGTLARTPPPQASWIDALLYQFQGVYDNLMSIRDYSYIKVFQYHIFVLVLVIAIVWSRLRQLSLLVFGAVVLPGLIQALARSLNIPIAVSYQWTILWQMVPAYLGIGLAYLLSSKPYWLTQIPPKWQHYNLYIKTPIALLCAVMVLYSGYQASAFLNSLSMAYASKRNSLAAINHYADLNTLAHQNYRTVTDSKSLPWSTPLYYDMDTFDGMQPAFPARRTFFMAYAVDLERKNYYPKSHFLNFFIDDEWHDINMLAMANVKYVLSSDEQLQPVTKLQPVLHIDAVQLDVNMGYAPAFTQHLIDRYGQISLVKPLNAFEVSSPWRRVFIPNKVQFSSHSYQSPNFYDELRELAFEEIAIAIEDQVNKVDLEKNSGIVLHAFELTRQGVAVTVNGQAGPLVYNQVYTPYWHSYCGNRELDITPANGIMMMVQVPEDCLDVRFAHELER